MGSLVWLLQSKTISISLYPWESVTNTLTSNHLSVCPVVTLLRTFQFMCVRILGQWGKNPYTGTRYNEFIDHYLLTDSVNSPSDRQMTGRQIKLFCLVLSFILLCIFPKHFETKHFENKVYTQTTQYYNYKE